MMTTVVLVILSKLNCGQMAKVSMYMTKKDTIYYSFYQRESIIKNSCPPSVRVLCFILVISVVKTRGAEEIYPGFTVFIQT